MKNYRLIFVAILTLNLVPALFLCAKGISYFSKLEGYDVATSYREFSKKVQAGSMSNSEIANRISKMASGEEKIARGFGMLKKSLYCWVIVFIAIAILQVYLLRALVNANATLKQRGSTTSA